MLIGTIEPTPPYDFEKSIGAARLHTVLDVIRPGEYWRALRFGSSTALVCVTNAGTLDAPRLNVHLVAATGNVDRSQVLQKTGWILGINADMQPFYDVARSDERLWRIVEPLYGLKHVRTETPFEALATTIIEQQIALSLAQRGERWLIQSAGEAIYYGSDVFHLFPTPERIACMTPHDLLPLKITKRRIEVLIDAARQAASGALRLDVQQPEALYHAVMSLHGVGHWTAAWTVIRSLGAYEYAGENDVALQAAINHFFFNQTGRTTPRVVRNTLARYQSFAGAAAFFTLIHWGLLKYHNGFSTII